MKLDTAKAGLFLACLLLLPVLFWRSTVDNFETPKASYLYATVLLLAAFSLYNRAVATDGFQIRDAWRRLDPVALSACAVLASALASTIGSKLWRYSLFGVEPSHAGLLTTAALVFFFFAIRSHIPDPHALRPLLAAPVVASAFLGLYACLQAVNLDPIPWSNTSDFAEWFRPFATLGHPSHLGGYLAMTLPLTLAFLFRGARQGKRWSLASLGLFLLAELAALTLSLARGGWIGAVLGLAVFVALTLREGPRLMRRGLIASAALGAGAAALAITTASGRQLFGGVLERSLRFRESPRGYLWTAALTIFKENPIFGSGLETFQFEFLKHRPVGYWSIFEWGKTPATAHSEPLQILATQGAFGALAFAALVASLFWAGRRALRRAQGDERVLVAGVVAGAIGYCAQAAVGFSVVATSSLFAAYSGILSGYALPAPKRTAPSAFRRPLLGLLLIGGGIFAAMNVVVLQPLQSGGLFAFAGRARFIAAIGLLVAIVLGAGSVLHLAGDGEEDASARSGRWTEPGLRGRWIRGSLAAGLVMGAGVLGYTLVIRPLRVSNACRRGLQWMDVDPHRAAEALQWAHFLEPHNDWILARLGMAFEAEALGVPGANEARELLLRARRALQRAIESNPYHPHHYANLGRVLAKLSAFEGATVEESFVEIDRGLALDPNNGELLYDAANTALMLGDLARASGYAATSLALYPEFAPSRAQLGYVALHDGRIEEAAALLKVALESAWPSHEVDRIAAEGNLAGALLQMGRPDDALPHARKAVEGAPGSPELRLNLARALEQSGK
jgi:O-antigen ligase/Flp pilus assembly protein TadD